MKRFQEKIGVKRAMKPLCFACLLCFFSFGFFTLYGKAQARTGKNEVFAIGTSSIVKGNLASAKERAISMALKKGVENYLIRRLGSQGTMNNFKRLVQDIIPKAKEEIENFNILTEEQIADEYVVLVKIRINKEVIDEKFRDAGLIFAEGPPIKVLFLVSEKKDSAVSYWWKDPEVQYALTPTEVVLHNMFQKRGFAPINRSLGLPELEYSRNMRSSELEDSDILTWGKLFSADLVIYGQTEIVDGKEVSMTLRALEMNHGIQICQGMDSEPIVKRTEGKEGLIEALEIIANRLAERLTPSIIRIAASDIETVRHLDVTLEGLSGYRDFSAFKNFLIKGVKGVKSVTQTRMRRNSISIVVDFQGGRDLFLDRVLNNRGLPFSVDLNETESGGILLIVNHGKE